MRARSLCAVLLVGSSAALAGENIDPLRDGSRHPYAENAGWLNAEPLGDGGPGVVVSDAELSGFIWSENLGWISLSCSNTASCAVVPFGVSHDGAGALSGYGWSENAGWIHFAPVGAGVMIDPATGEFSGHAWGENIGWLTFRSAAPVAFGVRTSWPVGEVRFASPLANAVESSGSAVVTVLRAGGSSGSVGVSYATTDGTAISPSDYAGASGTVTFGDGDAAPRTIEIPVVTDTLAEGDETFTVRLEAPTGGVYLAAPDSAIVTILDSSGSLSLGAAAYSVAEDAGQLDVTIARTGGSGGQVQVVASTSDGSATAPPDYLSTSVTAVFPDGDTSSRIASIPIVFDLIEEGDETLTLALGSPGGGASLGAPAAASVTIRDVVVPPAENIDPAGDGSQHAYGENIGWLNAEPLGQGGPGVRVGDTILGGYLWSENIGWISLSCANTLTCRQTSYGARNDGSGNLSGHVWSENAGWINFAPVGAGVAIDPATGVFSGHAWGENIGWITFSSAGPVPFRVRAGCSDADGDGFFQAGFLCPSGSPPDCRDGNSQVWGTPGEATDLTFFADTVTMSWSPPADPGGVSLRYDTLRSAQPADFLDPASCVETDGVDLMSIDASIPPPGLVHYYLVRAGNDCPIGTGAAGRGSDGTVRAARACP